MRMILFILYFLSVNPNLPAVHAVPSSGFSQLSGIVHSSLPSSVYPTPLVWPSKRLDFVEILETLKILFYSLLLVLNLVSV